VKISYQVRKEFRELRKLLSTPSPAWEDVNAHVGLSLPGAAHVTSSESLSVRRTERFQDLECRLKRVIAWARDPYPHFQLLMTWIMLASGVALSKPVFNSAERGCEPVTPGQPAGAYLRPSEPTRQRQFLFSEKFDPNTYERKVYVKRPNDKAPVLFYVHGRDIAPTIGHHERLVVINDYFATKGCRVMIADLKTHKSWNIDSRAMESYTRNAKPDPHLIIIPEAYGFSPCDREVLIGMDLIYVSGPTAGLAGELGKTYKRRWYVVDSARGHILHEYRTNTPPPCWWVY
jgi:hypothetical protein